MIELLDRPRRLFLPTQLSGCALWLRADMGVTLNGSTVSAWANQGTAGGSVTQGTAASQPTWSATGGPNSRATLQFDGGDVLANTTTNLMASGDPSTTFAVVKSGTAAGGAFFAQRRAGGDGRVRGHLAYVSGAQHFVSNNITDAGANIRLTGTPLGSITTAFIHEITFSAIGAAPAFYYNGTQRTVLSGTQQAESGTTGYDVGSEAGILPWTGDISELIVFTRVLTAAERAVVRGYLSNRYAIAVV